MIWYLFAPMKACIPDPISPSAGGAPMSHSSRHRPCHPPPPRHRDRLASRSPQVTSLSLEALRSARNKRCRCIATRIWSPAMTAPASRNPNPLDPSDLKRRVSIRPLIEGVPEDLVCLFYLDPTSHNADPNESVSANWEPPRGSPQISPDLFFVLKFQNLV
jgi:hypothetical protein